MVVLSELSLSEGSSSSSPTHVDRYDIFLSFRGVDTRHGFISHLYKALIDANIYTFMDDEEIEIGEDLKPELECAIKASRGSIIVLSKNYATSTWCLDELLLILEQRKTSNHIVFPIFYHVEPTHVRKQESSFRDAMTKHREMMEAETNANKISKWTQKMDRWKKALTEVADLKGYDIYGRVETEFIDEIVRYINRRLRAPLRIPLPLLIGMDYSIKFVTSWLKDVSPHTTDVLTILGMSGIGKTSLAKYIYALHYHEFETRTYIGNISRRCDEKFSGLLEVQKQLCDDISKTSSIQVHDVSIYTLHIENAVARKKVFLVLDDIDSLTQLDALLGSKGFHPGSKIIITTKDAWLTESCALFKTNFKPKHAKHMLKGLHETDSRKLLCFHAFLLNHPKAGYEEVSKKYVSYCEGHPLALEVLGKSLHNRDVAYWEECIEGLEKETDSPVNNVLKMSFDSLPSKNDKELFKHIACIFVGTDRDVTETILKACNINTRSGITNLIDRCLIRIGRDNELMMHQLLQKMGRFLVQQESPGKPWKQSRLWCHEESFKVLKQKNGTKNVLGLLLDMRMLQKKKLRAFELKADALSNMDNLMLLQLNYVQISGSYENFPEELRWLCMQGFPLKCIPLDLPMENLVALDMSYSNIESFGICYGNPQQLERKQKLVGPCLEDKRLPRTLKILHLGFCEQLRSLGGFDQLPELEMLILTNCTSLIEICDSVEQCVKLVLVDLSYCNKLEKLPRMLGMLKNVKTLVLDGCNLGESRIEIGDTDSQEVLNANNILEAIPSNLKLFAFSLPRYLVDLSLENNKLSTEYFPVDFSSLSMLKSLSLDNNPIVSMPNCVRSLPRIETLWMSNCKMLISVENPPHTLRELILDYNDHKPLLQKVSFDPKMTPLKFVMVWKVLAPSSFQFEGLVKIQPMVGVEGNLLRSLGWTNMHFLDERRLRNFFLLRGREECEIQMYYEFGIFSTIYVGREMPDWIMDRSTGPSISFTIPSSPTNLTGLNFCYVETPLFVEDEVLHLPAIIVCNITKNCTWIYQHYIDRVFPGGDCVILLSHWMFGKNEMGCGDHVTITVRGNPLYFAKQVTKECGVSFVYDDGEEEEDVLGYYKSWNHIIGGDLTGFQLTTGEYILHKWRILLSSVNSFQASYQHLCGEGARFKDKRVDFRALSPRKSGGP